MNDNTHQTTDTAPAPRWVAVKLTSAQAGHHRGLHACRADYKGTTQYWCVLDVVEVTEENKADQYWSPVVYAEYRTKKSATSCAEYANEKPYNGIGDLEMMYANVEAERWEPTDEQEEREYQAALRERVLRGEGH